MPPRNPLQDHVYLLQKPILIVVIFIASIVGINFNTGARAADLSPKPSCYTVSVTGGADIRCYIIGPDGNIYNWSGNSSGGWTWTQIGTNALNASRSLSCLRTRNNVNHCFYVATWRDVVPTPFGPWRSERGGLRWLRFSDGGAVTSTDLGDPGWLPGSPLINLAKRNVDFVGNELACAERGSSNAILCIIRTRPGADTPRKLFQIDMTFNGVVWSSSNWAQLSGSAFGEDLSNWRLSDCNSDPAVADECMFYKPSMIAGVSVSQMFPLTIGRSHPVFPGTGPVWLIGSLIDGPGAPPPGMAAPSFDAQITGGPRCIFVKRQEPGFPAGFRPFPWCFAIASRTRPGSATTVATLFGYNRITRNWVGTDTLPVEIGTTGLTTPEPDYEFQPACVPLTMGTALDPPRGGCLLVRTDGLLDVRVFEGLVPSSITSIGLGDVLGGGITGPPTCVSTTDPASLAHPGGRMDCFFRNGRNYLERITLSFGERAILVSFPRVELWSTDRCCEGRIRM
jgi:hypothetical protein